VPPESLHDYPPTTLALDAATGDPSPYRPLRALALALLDLARADLLAGIAGQPSDDELNG